MSTEAVQRAFADDTHTGTRAQVLTYLCWRANENGVAWPKRSTIADAVNVSTRQVKRHVQALQKRGHLWYRPGRGRGNASTYVPTVGLKKGDIEDRLLAAGLEKGDAQRRAQAQMQRRASAMARRKGDIQGQKGDTDDEKAPSGGGFSEKGTSDKRGHPGQEKGTPGEGFSDPPNDNISNPPEGKTTDKQPPATTPAGARGDGAPSGDSTPSPPEESRPPWWFLPENDRVYLATMRESVDEFSPSSIDRLVRRHWGGYRQGQVALSSLLALLESQQDQHGEREGFRRLVAGIVIAGNEGDSPGLKFLKGILDRFDEYRQQQNDRHQNAGDDRSGRMDAEPGGVGGGAGEYAGALTGR